MKKLPYVLPVLIFLSAFFLSSCDTANNRTFYIDSQTGENTNTGLSPEEAWADFVPVNEDTLQPGDHILIKAGTNYAGQLEIEGRGTSTAPIIVTRYGEGKSPVINGKGLKKYSLRIYNSEYVEVSNLDITNTGRKREAGRVGVLIEGKNYGEMHHIVIDSLNIHDVNGSLIKGEGAGSAIFWKNTGDSIPTRFVDLRIEYCHLYRCARNGITSSGYAGRDQWYPSLGVLIRDNLLEEIPGDGIVPIGCDSALIEYNIMRNSPDSLPFGQAAAGIWPWSCDHTLIQFNAVSGHKAKWDGQAYDCDFNCIGTIIQYNISHDNYGGFLLVCNPGENTPKNINVGTKNSVIRYNLSINDGTRPYPTNQEGWLSPAIHLTGPTQHTQISHNIFIIPEKKQKEIPTTFIRTGDWGNEWPKKTEISHNYLYTSGDIKDIYGNKADIVFEKNKKETFMGRDKATILSMIDRIIKNSEDSANGAGFRTLRHFVDTHLKEK